MFYFCISFSTVQEHVLPSGALNLLPSLSEGQVAELRTKNKSDACLVLYKHSCKVS